MKDFGFSDLRLKKSGLFSAAIKKGRRYYSPGFSVYALSIGEKELFMFGILNNMNIETAAKRNRIKRLIREFLRLNRHRIKKGIVLLIKPKLSLEAKKYNDVEKEFEELFSKKGLFDNNRPLVD